MKLPSTLSRPRMTDGLLSRNLVLSGGWLVAPIIGCTDTLSKALLLCFSFDAILVLTALLSFVVPKRLPYMLRILSYSLLAALVYLPVAMAADSLFPSVSIGLYLPLLTISPCALLPIERLLGRNDVFCLCGTVGCYLLGFDAIALLMGSLRELLAYGTLYGALTGISAHIPSAAMPFAGMMLLSCLCAIARIIRTRRTREETANVPLH